MTILASKTDAANKMKGTGVAKCRLRLSNPWHVLAVTLLCYYTGAMCRPGCR
ncbi:hypothetical protein PEC302107_16690 [Pectobacterium araliae]|nr:hypothetical protein PEC302107_16690 [Pectobacterium carotovorum subsp. carotovorum]